MKNIKEKLNKKLKAKAVVEISANKYEHNKPTAEIVDSLLGAKTKTKSSVGLRINSKKSVTKKCSDTEVKLQVKPPEKAKTVTPYIFIQDNLLRASVYADLDALHLDTKNNDNCIDFDAAVCLKFCEKSIAFYIEASENPMPEVLEEEGTSCFVKRFRPKGAYPVLQAMFLNSKGKTVYDSVTYPQLLKIVGRGLSKLIRVSGNLTLTQVQNLKLDHVEGKHFSYYSCK